MRLKCSTVQTHGPGPSKRAQAATIRVACFRRSTGPDDQNTRHQEWIRRRGPARGRKGKIRFPIMAVEPPGILDDDEGDELRNHSRMPSSVAEDSNCEFRKYYIHRLVRQCMGPWPAWRRLAEASMGRKELWIYTRLVQRCTRREHRGVNQRSGYLGVERRGA